MSSPAPRLALIVCDTPTDGVRAVHGDYPQIFRTLFSAALPDGLTDFVLDAYDVRGKMEYPTDDGVETYDGVVITGSAASAYEDIEWITTLVAWVARLASAKPHIKIIGICFGHQIVARALGGACVPNGGKWEVGVTEVALSPLGKRIFGAATINIEQMHRDHVPSVPPTFHLLGSTDVSQNQGMVRFAGAAEPSEPLPPIQILTLQGHPEFTASIVKELVDVRAKSGVLDAATAESARKRADWRNDGAAVVGKAIWGVLRA